MNAPITLPASSSKPGYEVWQLEASATPDGPWDVVNAGTVGSPLRGSFADEHAYYRVLWTAYTGAVEVSAPSAVPGANAAAPRGRERIRLVR